MQDEEGLKRQKLQFKQSTPNNSQVQKGRMADRITHINTTM